MSIARNAKLAALGLGALALGSFSTAPAHAGENTTTAEIRNSNTSALSANGLKFRFQIKASARGDYYIQTFGYTVEREPYTAGSTVTGTQTNTALSDAHGIWGYDASFSVSSTPIALGEKVRVTVSASYSGCGNDREIINLSFTYSGSGDLVAIPDIGVSHPVPSAIVVNGPERDTSYTLINLDGNVDASVTVNTLSLYYSDQPCDTAESAWNCVSSGTLYGTFNPGTLATGGSYTVDLDGIPTRTRTSTRSAG